ncbi:MAG: hypothetical protein FWD57_02570 [Polyangiaceae bacterium]|nr:hypothetical protein [Polyangiaceae bacterium]
MTLPAAATQKTAAAAGRGESNVQRPHARDGNRRPLMPLGDNVQWPDTLDNQGMTVIRMGSVYLNVSLFINNENRKSVNTWLSNPRQELPRSGGGEWEGGGTANMVMRVLSDPRLAARYDFTAEQLEQLKLVKFPNLELSEADH